MDGSNDSLPYSEDAEKGVLCSLILDPRLAEEIRSQAGPSYFYNSAHRYLYETLLKLLDSGKAIRTSPIDFNLLASNLADAKHPTIGTWLDEIGGKEALNQIYSHVPTASNWAYYADDVREKWARRQKILDCQHQEKAAYDLAAPATEWDPDGAYLGATVPRKLRGASFLDYSMRAINAAKTLLGNRYLCRGGGLFIVAPSGLGKSVLTAQAAIEFACGLRSFGIKPARPLKSLIIQAEDDDGDVIEMAQIVNHLELSSAQRKLVGENTHIEFVNDMTGAEFLNLCDGFLTQWRADLLWINPYTAYLGADIKDDEKNNAFLRNGLNPILTKHDCSAAIIHHTPKTNFRDTANWKPSDWMYSGAGAACLTNWSRAYLVIDPTGTPGVFKFIAAKRGKRIGWGDIFPVFEQHWAHSTQEGQLLWVPASQDQIKAAAAKTGRCPDDLLGIIPVLDPLLTEKIIEAAKEKNIGEKKARSFLKILIHDQKVFSTQDPTPGNQVGYWLRSSRTVSGINKTTKPGKNNYTRPPDL
jgi:hypothetical protein